MTAHRDAAATGPQRLSKQPATGRSITGLSKPYLRLAILAVALLVVKLSLDGTEKNQATGGADSPATISIPTPAPFQVIGYDPTAQDGEDALFEDATTEAGLTMRHRAARLASTPLPREQVAALLGTDRPTSAQINSWIRSNLTPFLVEHGTLEYWITGQAWGDVNGDGLADLYLTDQDGANRLLLNAGKGRIELAPFWTDVALADHISGGAVFADFDNDSWPDLLVLGDNELVLFRNESGRGFVDVTQRAGLKATGQGMTATWGDFDNDGNLDLYVVNYGCQPCNEAPPTPLERRDQDQLFRNRGDGTFENLTPILESFPATRGLGFSASWLDFDDDGRLDLYLVNDVRDDLADSEVAAGRRTGDGSTPGNLLLRNNGPGCGGWCFSDVTDTAGAASRSDGMGLCIGDLTGDGRTDLFFTNAGYRAGPARLLVNEGGRFREAAEDLGAHLGEWSWGCSLADFNLDGLLDIYVAVGHSELAMQARLGDLPDMPANADPEATRAALRSGAFSGVDVAPPPWPILDSTAPRTDNDRVLLQTPEGTFREVVLGPTDRFSASTFGTAVADYDDDGRPDLVVGNLDSGYRLLRNAGVAGNDRHRIAIKLQGDGITISRDAVGSRIRVTDKSGRIQSRWVAIGGSLGSGDDTLLLVGTGQATIVSVEVRWPDGVIELHDASTWTDRKVTIQRGSVPTTVALNS